MVSVPHVSKPGKASVPVANCKKSGHKKGSKDNKGAAPVFILTENNRGDKSGVDVSPRLGRCAKHKSKKKKKRKHKIIYPKGFDPQNPGIFRIYASNLKSRELFKMEAI